ncbi:phosphate signaling complex protein PhoU [Ornithinimicrobium pekingense]|uniref:Phosphate-specific transport system accessory protein PhoU n=1 Tax=Ornithinimicrobium pekingense TaxID=384677 RepID=A0ABQ2FD17_9MICO|nr:phosphate signaling complex protein PhoU [Ornithinimicrobium pekingense]GGK76975.1 phosphate transport system regulatory protein PhoU [Ornithinimicrobium pekingense]
MRSLFHEELDFISDQLVRMSRMAAEALERATRSLLEADLELAEQVITDDEEIDAVRRDLENRAIDVLARQQPVATDLRQLVTALRMCADLERSGDLARHVAKLARMRYPLVAVPDDLRPIVKEMSVLAEEMIVRAGEVVAAHDPSGAAELQSRDDGMDRLHREVFRLLLDHDTERGRQEVVDMTLLGRYYERYADHAVSVAIRVVFLVTGSWHDEQVPLSDAGRVHRAEP